MKLKSLILISLFGVLVTGCAPDGDFINCSGQIVEKSQHINLKKKSAAAYTIMNINERGFNDRHTYLVLPENFGNVGDIIKFTNGVMYAAPK